jgi:hypothetical protein
MDEATVKAMLEQHFTSNDPELSHEGVEYRSESRIRRFVPERAPRGES